MMNLHSITNLHLFICENINHSKNYLSILVFANDKYDKFKYFNSHFSLKIYDFLSFLCIRYQFFIYLA